LKVIIMSVIRFDTCSSNGCLGALQNILDGKLNIQKGLDDLCEAQKNLLCRRKCQAEEDLVEGIRRVKTGLCQIKEGLEFLHGTMDRKDLKCFEEGIRDICQGLKCLCEALDDLRGGRICEAEENLTKGIRKVQIGLCKIEKGIEGILNH
ncbi:MAG: hypothetical protein AAGU75_17565, partial [Bacillota bacterium]